jgi:hypothetical protein
MQTKADAEDRWAFTKVGACRLILHLPVDELLQHSLIPFLPDGLPAFPGSSSSATRSSNNASSGGLVSVRGSRPVRYDERSEGCLRTSGFMDGDRHDERSADEWLQVNASLVGDLNSISTSCGISGGAVQATHTASPSMGDDTSDRGQHNAPRCRKRQASGRDSRRRE